MLLIAAILICQPHVYITVHDKRIDVLTKKVDALTKKVETLSKAAEKKTTPSTKGSQEVPTPVLDIFAKRCGDCHVPGNKNGFTIFAALDEQNLIAKFSSRDLLAIDQQVYSGDCPQGEDAVPLPPDEYSILRAWINDSKPTIMKFLK